MNTTRNPTVGELVTEQPARARVFERYGIDYCCGGKQGLEEACAERNLDLAVLRRELEELDRIAPAGKDWSKASLPELADHIEQTHHQYLRQELPGLGDLIRKVVSVHGQAHPELAQVGRLYAAMRSDLEMHMMKEEQILFPMIRALSSATALPHFHCGSVGNPIRVMEMEHDQAGGAIHEMRRLTGNFQPPPEACNSYRAMLQRLAAFEADLHQHVHKENNILFPAAQALEARLAATAKE